MSSPVDVSFVIPAYQAESTIDRCVSSILRIDSFAYEVIVVNDGSTDGTRHAVDRIASAHPCVRLINQDNKGRSGARNRGMDSARGTWLMFVDADDYLREDAGQVISKHVASDADIVMFAYEMPTAKGGAIEITPSDFIDLVLDPVDFAGTGLTLEESRKYWFRSPDMRLFRRLSDAPDAPRYREGLRFGEDAIFNIEYGMACSSPIELEPRPIYVVDDSNSGTIRSFSASDSEAVARYSKCSEDLFSGRVDADRLRCFIGCEWHRLLWRAVRYGSLADVVGYLGEDGVAKAMGMARFSYPSERILCGLYGVVFHVTRSARLASEAVKHADLILGATKNMKARIRP